MRSKIKKILKTVTSIVGHVVVIFCVVLVCFILLLFSPLNTASAEMLHKFKSPSFSGLNTSSHFLTIDSQESSRRQSLKDEIEAYQDELARDAHNTTLARFIRNLESRIYAQLSRQMVEQLFGETPQESGKLELEGNTIEYIVENETITLTITDEKGGTTNITVPIGDFTF